MSRADLQGCLDTGRLVRVRKGRYLPGTSHPDLIRAAASGGRIDCISLLHLVGVHVLDHRELHVQISNGSSRLPPRPRDLVHHWRPTSAGRRASAVTIIEALAQAIRCQSPRDAIATLDSAWHLGLIDEPGIGEVFRRLPARYAPLRPLLDPRAESGPESLMRLMVRALGFTFQVQVHLEGVGRVDFVVDGWLIIECDSRAHHEGWEAQKRDRRRDIAAAKLGFTTIRPIAEDILYRRDEAQAALKAVLEAGQRRGNGHELSKKSRRRG